MFRYILFIFLFVISCARKAPILEGYEEGVYLGFSFVPGQSLKYKITSNITQTIEVNKAVPTTNNIIMEMKTTQTVIDTGETTNIQIIYDEVTGNMMIGQELKPIEELHKLNGCTLMVSLSRAGKVTNLSGERILEYYKRSGEKVEAELSEKFSFLPNKLVKIGEKWEKEFDGTKNIYTLKNIVKKDGKECAEIKVESNIEKTFTQMGMSGKISGKAGGTIYFDLNNKVIVEEKSTASLEGGAKSGAMEIPILMDITSSTNLLE